MNNEINLDELMTVSGGQTQVHQYLENIARKNNLFLEGRKIDLAAVKKILTPEDKKILSLLALNRPIPADISSDALA